MGGFQRVHVSQDEVKLRMIDENVDQEHVSYSK